MDKCKPGDAGAADVTTVELITYRDKVLDACERKVAPPTLPQHLKRPEKYGDVSKAIWERYHDHAKEKGRGGTMLLNDFIRSVAETSPDTQLIRFKPDATIKTHGPDLVNNLKPGVGLCFTGAIFGLGKSKAERESEWGLNRTIDVQGNAMMAKLGEVQNKVEFKDSMTESILPIANEPFPETEDHVEANKQALLHLRNFINDVKLSNIQNVIKTKWGGKKVKYASLKWDPRLLPKDCAKKEIAYRKALFDKAFYSNKGKRFYDWESTAKNIRSWNANDLVKLEQWLGWEQRQLNDEFNRGTLVVNKRDKLTLDQLRDQVDPVYRATKKKSGQDAGFDADEFTETKRTMAGISQISFEDASKRLGDIRSAIMKDIAGNCIPEEAEGILIPKDFASQNYPNASNDEHIVHIHRIAGESGWGPNILTTEERKIYDETIANPLPLSHDKDLLSLAAYSKAAVRMNASLDSDLNEEDMISHANAIMLENSTKDQHNMLIHQACAAHVMSTNKKVLDLNGPLWTVRDTYEGAKEGWDDVSPNKVAHVVRGISEIMDENNSSKKKQGKSKLLARVFGTQSAKVRDEIQAIATAATKYVRSNANVGISLTETDLQHFATLTGAVIPFRLVPCDNIMTAEDAMSSYSENTKENLASLPKTQLLLGMHIYPNENESVLPKDALVVPEVKNVEPEKPKFVHPQTRLLQKIIACQSDTKGGSKKIIADLSRFNNHLVFVPSEAKSEGNTWIPDAHAMYATPENINRLVNQGVVKMTDGTSYQLDKLVDKSTAQRLQNQMKTHAFGGKPLSVSITTAIKETPLKR